MVSATTQSAMIAILHSNRCDFSFIFAALYFSSNIHLPDGLILQAGHVMALCLLCLLSCAVKPSSNLDMPGGPIAGIGGQLLRV